MEATEQKPWQKGIDIDIINGIKENYTEWNAYSRSPFSEMNGPAIAKAIDEGKLEEIKPFDESEPIGWIETALAKTSTAVTMFYDVVIAKRMKGDRVITRIACPKEHDHLLIEKLNEYKERCFLHIWEEDARLKNIADTCGFKRLGTKINTFSEMTGIYFRESSSTLFETEHPLMDPAEESTLLKLNLPDFTELCDSVSHKLLSEGIEYQNHYSKYNKSKSWGAISLRGYSPDPNFIENPKCMNDKWHKEHEGENFELQDTEVRALFPEVEEILEHIPGVYHRIRFMRLKPGGGELQRHTDQVEPDAGVRDERLIRLHVPIKTNPKVEFSAWNCDGEKRSTNMVQGSTWYLDIRKPHTAINHGDDERIHLVIDVESNEQLRDLLRAGIEA
jgi:hypothetical protein